MAIQSVRVYVNGAWTPLTYDSDAGLWRGTVTAPGATSFHQSGGYFSVQAEAVNTAGTAATADASTLAGLRLFVRETVAPVVTILSPTSGAYVANNRQPVVLTAVDEQGGSGVKLETLAVLVDGAAVTAGIESQAVAGGYSITFTPPSAMADGSHTVRIRIADHDGNQAAEKSTTYTIDTVPPVLNISSPIDGMITAVAALTVAGSTNDLTSSPVTVTVSLGGADQGAVAVGQDGAFSKAVTLAEGENVLVVRSVDAAGKQTTVTRTVTLDTSVPRITDVTMTPNPADAGQTMTVEVTVQ